MSTSESAPTTLAQLLERRAERDPDRLGYTFISESTLKEQRLTYAELDRRARRIAAIIAEQNPDGRPVPLLYDPGLDYIAAFFGCSHAGVPAVPLYPPRGPRTFARLQAVLTACQAAVVLTNTRRVHQVEQKLAHERLTIVNTDTAGSQSASDVRRAAPDSIALIQYTSGSTDEPRGVALTHANILFNSAAICDWCEHSDATRGVSWLPPYHDMGLIGSIVQPLFAKFPATLFSPHTFLHRPATWLELIARVRATTSGAPNFAYDLCVERVSPDLIDQLDLTCWTIAFCGAEPVRATTLRRFAEVFGRCGFRASSFRPCYGLAEAALIVSGRGKDSDVAVRERDGRPIVSCGPAIPGQRIAIVDPEDRVALPDGQVGEIWVSGPSVASGYWQQPQETRAAFDSVRADTGEGGFLRTGDLGFLQGGELYVTGRLKELIIIGGRNYHPHDIEDAIASAVPALAHGGGAAFSVNGDGGERLVVIQEPNRSWQDSAFDEVRRAARRTVSEQFGISLHDLVLIRPTTLPRTSSGKPRRFQARALYLSRGLALLEREPGPAS